MLAVDIAAGAVMGIDLHKVDTYREALELFGAAEVKLSGRKIDEAKINYRQGCLFSTRVRYIKETAASLAYRMFNRH